MRRGAHAQSLSAVVGRLSGGSKPYVAGNLGAFQVPGSPGADGAAEGSSPPALLAAPGGPPALVEDALVGACRASPASVSECARYASVRSAEDCTQPGPRESSSERASAPWRHCRAPASLQSGARRRRSAARHTRRRMLRRSTRKARRRRDPLACIRRLPSKSLQGHADWKNLPPGSSGTHGDPRGPLLRLEPSTRAPTHKPAPPWLNPSRCAGSPAIPSLLPRPGRGPGPGPPARGETCQAF